MPRALESLSVRGPRSLLWSLALCLAACSEEAPKTGSGPDGTGDAPSCATATRWVDADGDGFGDDALPEEACIGATTHADVAGDCNDEDAAIHPGATETCNGIDDDCDGAIDRGLTVEAWTDADADGYGDPTTAEQVCTLADNQVRNADDCDDTSAAVSPAASEVCNGIDDNCDSVVDDDAIDRIERHVDEDGDGLGTDTLVTVCPDAPGTADNAWDCDDADATTPIVVDATASADPDGTLAAPYTSVSAAVDAATLLDGDACVLVQPGTYSESVDLSGGDVLLESTAGADATTIDASGTGLPTVVLGDGNRGASTISGFTLTGGTPVRTTVQVTVVGQRLDLVYDRGAGIYAQGAEATVEDCAVRDLIIEDPELPDYEDGSGRTVTVTWEGQGAGVWVEDGGLTVIGGQLSGNVATHGGAAAIGPSGVLDLYQTTVLANDARQEGGGVSVYGGHLSASNVIFAGNRSSEAATVLVEDSTADLSQVTVWDDATRSPDEALLELDDSQGTWDNLIVQGSAAAGIEVIGSSSSLTLRGLLSHEVGRATRQDTLGLITASGLSTGDPLFVSTTDNGDYEDDDLHVDPTSPAVDAGPTGRDPDGSPADLGAYGGEGGDWGG